jgi:hypothetical protein
MAEGDLENTWRVNDCALQTNGVCAEQVIFNPCEAVRTTSKEKAHAGR